MPADDDTQYGAGGMPWPEEHSRAFARVELVAPVVHRDPKPENDEDPGSLAWPYAPTRV